MTCWRLPIGPFKLPARVFLSSTNACFFVYYYCYVFHVQQNTSGAVVSVALVIASGPGFESQVPPISILFCLSGSSAYIKLVTTMLPHHLTCQVARWPDPRATKGRTPWSLVNSKHVIVPVNVDTFGPGLKACYLHLLKLLNAGPNYFLYSFLLFIYFI